MGRPSKFKNKYAKQAYEVCSIFGADDQKLAEFFQVEKTTIENWKNRHPGFFDSIKKGKDEFDTKNVESALLKRAMGYEFTETTYERITLDAQGEGVTGEDRDPGAGYGTKVKTVVKFLPPDPTSIIFWLKKRHRGRWMDRPERPLAFRLPKTVSVKDVPKLTSTLLKAVGQGKMTTSEASNISALGAAHGRSLELMDIEKRLSVLEYTQAKK